MSYTQEQLAQAANEGSKKVAEAFERLSGISTSVDTSSVAKLPLSEILEKVNPNDEHAVVIYSQFIDAKPTPGISILLLSREGALALVDLLNQLPVGTTGIMKSIDRSALKETLNILSNSYMTALAEAVDIEVGLSVPNMITATRLKDILLNSTKIDENESSEGLLFKSEITIGQSLIQASLYIVFNKIFFQPEKENLE
ncbi:MAG: hypothetical protein COU65_01965 [Candidatus Pacebacteria bacterium CG10_big_fil_rev_8_21_14_0_10_42_12]|nr:hypothetical protein [Candidatus Parcubacteria bacterium]NCS66779.1 hypothetical protein [Candidatus Peregrinibacteria bacterium]PIR62730.1 MAG: hypothetical protein COU65_01965 [Candidatus Pacebacteria bacterium CG10_big_fil_rev_8_21_14_0_10_42_12]